MTPNTKTKQVIKKSKQNKTYINVDSSKKGYI